MRLGARVALAVAIALTLASTTAPAAVAETETVETPAGTFYLIDRSWVDPPTEDTDEPPVCVNPVGGFEFCPDVSLIGETNARVHVSLWQEANGCEGLQQSAIDCNADGEAEASDEEIHTLHV